MRHFVFAAVTAATLLCAPAARALDNDPTVPTYHADAARSGHYVVPGLTWERAANMQRDAAFDGRVPGNVYAQPLYWRPPGSARGLVIVATEENVVVALDAVTGSTVWQSRLGPPVPLSKLPCGNIDPLGITGTPVIDERGGALYLDAMVDRDNGPRHLVFGLSLSDGAVLPGWPVDVAESLGSLGIDFAPLTHNQRGALALVGDRLYVPYHGHFFSCGEFHGSVVGLRLDQPAVFAAWRTWANKGGNWAPGGIAYDGHDLFVITEGTVGGREWSGGNAVIRLPLDLHWQPTSQDFFAVEGNVFLMGVTNPLPIDLPDPDAGRPLLLALDRDGTAYLLDRADLGGHGHALVGRQVASGIPTSPAAYRDGHDMLVAFQTEALSPESCPGNVVQATKLHMPVFQRGLVTLRVSGGSQPAMQTAWCAKLNGQGAAIVTTSDDAADPIVWIVGAEGDNRLHGFRGDNGQEVFTSGPLDADPGHLRHFVTILAAAGRLYFAGDGQVYAFGLAR